jgi:transposase
VDSHPSSTSSVCGTKREVPKSREDGHGLCEGHADMRGSANLLLEATVVGPEVNRDTNAGHAAFVDLELKLAMCDAVVECIR